MQLHRFSLDMLATESREKGEYFFYRNDENILSAWSTKINKEGSAEVKAYKEIKHGSMALIEMAIISSPVHINGIEESGCLILETENGILECHAKGAKLQLIASRKKFNTAELLATTTLHRFPGMIQTDCLKINNIKLARFTNTPHHRTDQDRHKQSFLIAQFDNNTTVGSSNENIMVGNPTLDNTLSFVPAARKNFFTIAVNDFALDYKTCQKNVRVAGWNQKEIEIIELSSDSFEDLNQYPLSTKNHWKLSTGGALLHDQSSRTLDQSERVLIFRDLLKPYNFYCLEKQK